MSWVLEPQETFREYTRTGGELRGAQVRSLKDKRESDHNGNGMAHLTLWEHAGWECGVSTCEPTKLFEAECGGGIGGAEG